MARRSSGAGAEELCETHGAPLQYFCRTCSVSICAGDILNILRMHERGLCV